MRIVTRPRAGGKTTEAAQWVKADPNRVLLVVHESERRRLVREFGLPDRQVVLAHNTSTRLLGRRNARLGVDNIDLMDWRTVLELGSMYHAIELATETRP